MKSPARTTPRVSVVMPVYNAAETVGDALASAFRQRRDDFEMIVVDDGSQDVADLRRVLLPYRDRIRFFSQPNAGAGAARNLGIRHARGPLLAFLDADDLWEPSFLERQVAVLDAHPQVDMVWTDGRIIGDTPLAGCAFLESTGTSAAPTFLTLIRQTCTVLTSAVVVRRDAVIAAGGFNESLRRGQDFDLWLRLAHAGAVMAVVQEPLVCRRIHTRNLSGDRQTELARARAVLEHIGAAVRLNAEESAALADRIAALTDQLEIELAKVALREGRVRTAREHLAHAGTAANWKTRTAALALHVAPGLLRRAYTWSSLRSRGLRTPSPA